MISIRSLLSKQHISTYVARSKRSLGCHFQTTTKLNAQASAEAPTPTQSIDLSGRSVIVESDGGSPFNVPVIGSLEHDEQQLWAEMTTADWHDSINVEGNIFENLYEDTRNQIREQILIGEHDVVIEVGCGTGEVIGQLTGTGVHRIGVDINPSFVNHAESAFGDDVDWHVADATALRSWWDEMGYNKYERPLVVMVNNTIMIMPEEIRGVVCESMMEVAGDDGRCLVTYWSGNCFERGIDQYYKKNPALCGPFDAVEDVNYETRTLTTPSGYMSQWLLPEEVAGFVGSLTNEIVTVADGTEAADKKQALSSNFAEEIGLGIFAWFQPKKAK